MSASHHPFRRVFTLDFKYKLRTAMRNNRVLRYLEKRLNGFKESCCISSSSFCSVSLRITIRKSDNGLHEVSRQLSLTHHIAALFLSIVVGNRTLASTFHVFYSSPA